MTAFTLIIGFVIIQRIVELIISKKNAGILRSEGGVEYGANHYKYIVAMHTMFLLSIVAEYLIRYQHGKLPDISIPFLIFFALLQLIRVWIITSLGKYWNTRIIVVPGAKLVKSGPYRFARHPNYVVVVCEIFCLPMIFGLYYTAVIFTILNFVMLSIRIKEENKVLYKTS